MKKLKYFIIVIVLFISCNDKEQRLNLKKNKIDEYLAEESIERNDLNLRGDVRSLIEYELQPKDTVLDENKNTILNEIPRYKFLFADTIVRNMRARKINNSYSILFNTNGKAIKSIWWYRIKGQADTWNTTEYLYDTKGNLLEKEMYFAHGFVSKELRKKHYFEYDNKNKLQKLCVEKKQDKGRSKNCTTIIYKEKDILLNSIETDLETGDTIKISHQILNKNGIITEDSGIEIRSFDKNGNLSKIIERDTFFNINRYKILYNYDTHNNLIQEASYNQGNELVHVKSYVYDEEGRIRLKINSDSNELRREYFNTGGELSKSQNLSFFDSSYVHSSIDYQYDDYQNLVSRESIYKDSMFGKEILKIEYSLEYDKFGNWIEKKTIKNDSLILVKRREIFYY